MKHVADSSGMVLLVSQGQVMLLPFPILGSYDIIFHSYHILERECLICLPVCPSSNAILWK